MCRNPVRYNKVHTLDTDKKKPATLRLRAKSNSRRVGGDRCNHSALHHFRLLYCRDNRHSQEQYLAGNEKPAQLALRGLLSPASWNGFFFWCRRMLHRHFGNFAVRLIIAFFMAKGRWHQSANRLSLSVLNWRHA